MSDIEQLGRGYFLPAAGAFWSWSDEGRVLTWEDGATIAFLPELVAVMHRLAGQNLPSFAAVALLLAACREGWREPGSASERFADSLTQLERFDLFAASGGNEVLSGLEAVRELPLDIRTSLAGKCAIAEMVFEGLTHDGDRETAEKIVESLRERSFWQPPPSGAEEEPTAIGAGATLGSLYQLRSGLSLLTEERIRLRMATGLDNLILPAETEPMSEQVRTLLSSLSRDDELAGLASVARNVMAAVRLPRPLCEPEDLPIGGVSDITNRGSLDRLLPSELVHDDLTLAVRVAMNEALYFRREAPPRMPVGQRVILLDIGIRMWGLPRVYGTAIALALAATSDPRLRLEVYQALGSDIIPARLATRAGLIEALARLDTSPHPAAALPKFFATIDDDEVLSDLILVTHRDVLADPIFRKALAAIRDHDIFVAAVDGAGSIDLWRIAGRGERLESQCRLSLDELLPQATSTAIKPLVDLRYDPALPRFYRQPRRPLAIPHPIEMARTIPVEGFGVVAFPKHCGITLWQSRSSAPIQLSDRRLVGSFQAIGVLSPGTALAAFFVGRRHDFDLVRVDIPTGRVEVIRTVARPLVIRRVELVGEVLCVIRAKGMIDILDARSGRYLDESSPPPGFAWHHRRFCRQHHPPEWRAMTWDGQRLRYVPLKMDAECVALFDRRGVDGPWYIDDMLRFRSTLETDEDRAAADAITTLRPGPTVRCIASSSDGNRHVLKSLTGDARYFADLDRRKVEPVGHYAAQSRLEPLFQQAVHTLSMRTRYQAVAVDGGMGVLLLQRGFWWQCQLDGDRLKLAPAERRPPRQAIRWFEPAPHSKGAPRGLKVASWNATNRAYLDPCGILHLCCANPAIPELSLALSDEPLAAWCSNGVYHGNAYFMPTTAEHIYPASGLRERLLAFAAEVGST